ncbi:MAG: H-NS histone family protein [Rhodomicrobium sp.]
MARSLQPHAKSGTQALDFSHYSFEDLLEIMKHLDAEVESRKAKEIAELRLKVEESAKALGVTVEELVGVSGNGRRKRETKHPRGPQPPKYRGPNGEEWSGRGPSPRWMKPLLAKGKTKEDFLIR